MKNNIIIKSIALIVFIAITFTSCIKDLDVKPKYGLNSETLYSTLDGYRGVLAKLYASFSTTGNQGPAGSADISGIDEGFSQYMRVLWNLQELPSDEAVCGWNDPGIPDMNKHNWTSSNPWSTGMYYRIYFTITLCNEFIRESTNEKLNDRGFSDNDKNIIFTYRAEARFIRALAYYHQMDLFGKGPFVDENDLIGSFFPPEISRQGIFNYVESELKDVENSLADAKANEYARADKAAAWSVLAKMYLNAQVYTGQSKYSDCVTYCNKVINAGYSLDNQYKWLFLSDNHKSTEVIFPITSDGLYTQSYGGTTFLTHASIGGSMKAKDTFGVNGGWFGLRSKGTLVDLFADTTLDSRYLFHLPGQTKAITNLSTFTQGYPVTKWRNRDRNGVQGSDATGNFTDTDFPMFRLADVYLMYAEATLRGGNGDAGLALNYVNALRQRAYGVGLGTVPNIDLDFILAERGRELYYEATRRTDLIRYGLFTGGTYVWPFKGGDVNGVSIDAKYNLYPIPSSDLNANPNLTQNPGY
jgi:starch-binding outer membrane protein, SusD/RagB family